MSVNIVVLKLKGALKMKYRRKSYKIKPEKLNDFNTFLYPNQIKHGAKLIGRWIDDNKDEVLAI